MSVALRPDSPVALFLARLSHVKPAGSDRWMARCPSHDDAVQSLSIRTGKDGRVLLNCHAGCTFNDVVQAVGLAPSDLFTDAPRRHDEPKPVTRDRMLVKTYDYVDEHGALLYQACRYEPKDFRPRRRKADGDWEYTLPADQRRVLYRLPDVIEAAAMGRPIYLVEGEKDADALAELGYAATTWVGGAKSWRDEYAATLKGADVICLPDNDDPGRSAMGQAAAALAQLECLVKVVALPGLPPKGDVSDWLDAGHDLDELAELVGKSAPWTPDPSTRTRWRLDELWANDELMRMPLPVVPRIAWPARSTLVAAAEKSGKSTLTGFIASQVSRDDGTFLGDACRHGAVLIFGLEEFIGDTARRLHHFAANPKRIHVVPVLAGDPKDRPSLIRSHVEAVQPVLVIVDTLMAYSEGLITEATSSSQMQPVVQSLTSLAHETGVALILVHHARKSDGKYRDSSAIGGAVDAIIEVFQPDEDGDPRLRRARARGRMPVNSFDFRYDGQTYALVSGAEAPLELRIVECVRGRPGCSANDVVEAVGGNRRHVLATITHLAANGSLLEDSRGSGKRLYAPGTTPQLTIPRHDAA